MEVLAHRHTQRTNRRHALRLIAWLLLAGLVAMIPVAPAGAQRGAELDELKAAFVFQFAKFVEWPADAFENDSAPLVISIVNNERMAQLLMQSVQGKNVAGHPLQVTHKERPEDLQESHIVFFDASERRNIDEALEDIESKPILSVSDEDDFTKNGGVIRLYQQASKLRIEINVDAADRAGLKISSKLLSLARVVRDET